MKKSKDSHKTRSGAPSQPERASKSTRPQGNPEKFAPVIFTYSRKDALADGVQVDVSKMAAEAGFKVPVFLTAAVHDEYVKIPEGVTGQDEEGRLWDLLWMTRYAISRAGVGARRLLVALYVRNSDAEPAGLVFLAAEIGALDFDDPRPAITISLPDED